MKRISLIIALVLLAGACFPGPFAQDSTSLPPQTAVPVGFFCGALFTQGEQTLFAQQVEFGKDGAPLIGGNIAGSLSWWNSGGQKTHAAKVYWNEDITVFDGFQFRPFGGLWFEYLSDPNTYITYPIYGFQVEYQWKGFRLGVRGEVPFDADAKDRHLVGGYLNRVI